MSKTDTTLARPLLASETERQRISHTYEWKWRNNSTATHLQRENSHLITSLIILLRDTFVVYSSSGSATNSSVSFAHFFRFRPREATHTRSSPRGARASAYIDSALPPARACDSELPEVGFLSFLRGFDAALSILRLDYIIPPMVV